MFTIGKKNTMKEAVICFYQNANMEDIFDDLHEISEMLLHFNGFKKGNRISSIGHYMVKTDNELTGYRSVEVYSDEINIKEITDKINNGGFKAISFISIRV